MDAGPRPVWGGMRKLNCYAEQISEVNVINLKECIAIQRNANFTHIGNPNRSQARPTALIIKAGDWESDIAHLFWISQQQMPKREKGAARPPHSLFTL